MKTKDKETLIKNAASMAKTSLEALYRSVLYIEANGAGEITSDEFKRVVDGASDSTARLHSLLLYEEFELLKKRKKQR